MIQCSNKWELENIHTSILKKAGYEITVSEKKAASGTDKIKAGIKAGFLDTGVSASAERTDSESKDKIVRELELDPLDVNDIIRALQETGFDKYIVLEDFHYLPIDTQKDFSVALKAFHETSSFSFIIVGVWLEENRLIVHNGDLTGRVISVNADIWKRNQLRRVIEKGEEVLKVKFNLNFKDNLIVIASIVYILCKNLVGTFVWTTG